MSKPTEKKRPDFHAFYVPDRENAYWTRIGAAWKHEDRKGITLDLDLIPVTDRRIVLRTPETKNGDEA